MMLSAVCNQLAIDVPVVVVIVREEGAVGEESIRRRFHIYSSAMQMTGGILK